jgi:hypothetical protein
MKPNSFGFYLTMEYRKSLLLEWVELRQALHRCKGLNGLMSRMRREKRNIEKLILGLDK